MDAMHKWVRQWADKEGFRPMVILWLAVGVTLSFFVIASVSVWDADRIMLLREKRASDFATNLIYLLTSYDQRTDVIIGAAGSEDVDFGERGTDVRHNLHEAMVDAGALLSRPHVASQMAQLQAANSRLLALQDTAFALKLAAQTTKSLNVVNAPEYYSLERALRSSVRDLRQVATSESMTANHIFNAELAWIAIAGGIFLLALGVAWVEVMRLVDHHLKRLRTTEANLRESEQKYRMLIDALPHAVLIAQDGTFRFCNPAGAAMFGRETPAEMEGVVCLDVVSDVDRTRAAQSAEARSRHESEMPTHLKIQMRKANGEEFAAEVYVSEISYRNREASQYVVLDVTERQRAENALRDSEEKYRTLIDALPHTVVIAQDGKVMFCNPATAATFCFRSAQDITGLDIAMFIPPRERARILDYSARRLAGETALPDNYAVMLQRKNQEEFPAEIFVQCVTFRGRQALQIAILDSTERQRAEQALRESEERFRNLSDTAPVLIWMAGVARHTFYFNKSWTKFTGRTVGVEYGHGWKQGVHPEDLPRCMSVYESAFESRTAFTVEFRLRNVDGTDHWVLDTGVPRFTADGSFAGFLGSCVDITTRRAIEEALRESERRFRELADFLPHAIFETDEHGGVTFASQRAFETFGYTARDFERGINVLDVLAPADRERAQENISRVMRNESSDGGEYLGRHKDGRTFPVMVDTNVRMVDGKPCGLRGMVIDITDRKRAEDELWRVNSALKTSGECNQALVHAQDEASLLGDICQIIVENGGHRMAWVGFVDKDDAIVRPVAHAGSEHGYLQTVKITWDDTDAGCGSTGTAIKTRRFSLNRDIVSEPSYTRWQAEAVKRGYRSSIALPLIAGGECIGALNIYAGKTDAFDAAEVRLLSQLADDLAFGITALRARDEQMRIEAALRESEITLQRTFEQSPVGAAMVGPDGHFLRANETLCHMLGYTPEEMRGLTFLDITHPDDHARDRHNVELLATGDLDLYETDKRYLRKDGRCIWGRLSVCAIKDAEGRLLHFLPMVQDISERKHAEALLKEQAAAIESAIDGMAILDQDRKFLYVNAAFARTFGYQHPHDLVGMPGEILYDAQEQARFRANIFPALCRDGRWQGAAVGQRKDGSLFRHETSLSRTDTGGLVATVRYLSELDAADPAGTANSAPSSPSTGNVETLAATVLNQLDSLLNLRKGVGVAPQSRDDTES